MRIKFIILMLFTFKLLSYNAKVIFIDNNFKTLNKNEIKKVIYLSSEISFDIKEGKIFNLYRNIETEVKIKTGSYTDLNKEVTKKSKTFKKVCVIQLEVISVVENLIKAIEIKKCKNQKDDDSKILGEFELSKTGDFIEIETIFDKKNKKTINENKISDIIASIYMIGIDDDFNYLLESGIKEVNKSSDINQGLNKPNEKIDGEKKKKELLPKKKKEKKKKKKKKGNGRVPNFEKIRL